MSETRPSSRSKPNNVFYVWYGELCRRLNTNPSPIVKPAKPKCQTVLDFVADRLKVEEWAPVISALRYDTSLHVINVRSRLHNCQFLHDIDTEEKTKRMKRKGGLLWTAFILKSLLKSLSFSVRSTQVLTCLELDGLPMFSQYLEPLLQALKKNKTIKSLSFAHCTIKDIGCQLVCAHLRFTPNVEILNLSDCGLTSESGANLAKLIKFQQINRYCESWHNSLRYEDPESANMRGIKRITLNCNPSIGDEGLDCILNELEDDLWIKALDLQKCGITEKSSHKILYITETSRSLEIFDVRQNDLISMSTIEKVLQLLKDKEHFVLQPEFQWCNTAVSLTWNSVLESNSKLSQFSSVATACKTKSAPIKLPGSSKDSKGSSVTFERILKKSATTNNIPIIKNGVVKSNSRLDVEIAELNNQLREEKKKRQETERKNEELQHRLREINSRGDATSKIVKTILKPPKEVPLKNGVVTLKNGYCHNGTIQPIQNGKRNVGKNGVISSACKIFEKLMMKGHIVDDDLEDKELLNSYVNREISGKESKSLDISDSQASLYKFMEELKNNAVSNNGHFIRKPCSMQHSAPNK